MIALLRACRPLTFNPQFTYIPPYKPTKPVVYESIKFPPRPKLDDNDPTEVYKVARMPRLYNEVRSNFKKVHTIGSQYVSVTKEGKTYHLFDASRMPFGRMCQRIAMLVQGKHKPTFKHNQTGTGDLCIVVNAENMRFTGKKIYNKHLTYHTGYIGHLRQIPYKKLIKEKPEQLISWGVWRFLPRNRLRISFLEYLDVFRSREHTYTKVLPQIMPRPVVFRYESNVYEDLIHPDSKILYSQYPIKDDEFGGALKDKKIEPLDLDDEVFTPFTMRTTESKFELGAQQRQKLINAHKRLLKRHRRYYAQNPNIRDKSYNPEWTYLVKSDRQLKQLGLQARDPVDEDPEIEDETIK